MKLYCARNTISVASAITLEELGLDYEPVILDFSKGVQTQPEYLAINPKGRVPALVTETGILTETGAILEYASSLSEHNLVPDDPWQAGQMRAATYYLAATMHVNHAHMRRGMRWANKQSSFDDMAEKATETMAQSAAFVEENFALSPFVIGETMTIADPWLFVVSTWLKGDGVDIEDYPRLAAFHAMMAERPSVKAVRAAGILA